MHNWPLCRSRHKGQAVAAWARTSMLVEGWVVVGAVMPAPPWATGGGVTQGALDHRRRFAAAPLFRS